MNKSFTLLLFFFTSFNSFSQLTAKTDSALNKLNTEYPQEKVFLQTDRSIFYAGETIWMKAWCTLDGLPSYLSKILYVDLVNSSGTVVVKKMYQLDSLSTTAADIDLPATLPSGNYRINAYTLWMLNFPGFVYGRDIFIYANDYKIKKENNKTTNAITMQFFPEGGNLIAGVNNRIAFKISDNRALPVVAEGMITDDAGNKLASFVTEHNGMGVFELEIQPGKKYVARVPVSNGREMSFPLPPVQSEGIVLKVENNNPKKLFVLLERSETNKNAYGKINIVAQNNHHIVFRASLDLDADQNAFAINKKDLPPGIIQITAFNDKDEPLAERLAFIENYETVKPLLQADTLAFTPGAINHFSFTLPKSGLSSVSVAVTDASIETNAFANESIVSSLLLTSDLKGTVYEPGYYFKDKEPVTLKHLDLLMMINGWRRFEWKQVLANHYPTLKYPVESAIWIGGKVTKSDRKEVVKEGMVSFVIKGEDSTSVLAEAHLTDKGEFLLTDLNYRKSATIAYQGTNAKKQHMIVDVHLEPGYIDSLHTSAYKPQMNLDTFDLQQKDDELLKYVFNKIISDTAGKGYLGNVTVTRKKVSKEDSLNNIYASGAFMMGQSVDPQKYKYYTTPWQILQASTPGIRVEGNMFDPNIYFSRFQGLNAMSDNVNAITVGESSSGETVGLLLEENGIAFFLNEVNVSKDVINGLNINDIALIKVMKNEGAALGATQGAIAFYTKKGAVESYAAYEKNFSTIQRMGYSIAKHFYTPMASEIQPGNDKRITLYWNPGITPLSNGTYYFRFNNNDAADKYKVMIQGIDRSGSLIFFEKIFAYPKNK